MEDCSGEYNSYHAQTSSFGIGNSIIVDGNYISHMNNSEMDDKNRFCISTEQESKTLASYQDPKTRRATKRYEDS